MKLPLYINYQIQSINSRVTLTYPKDFAKSQKDKPIICITGHFGNWDITARILKQNKENISIVYIEMQIIQKQTISIYQAGSLFSITSLKALMGLKRVFQAIKNKDTICFFGDQKLNSGMPVTFFGKTAMTPTAPMKIALKIDLPIFFAYTSRIKGAHFKTHLEGPYSIEELLKNKKNISDKELALTQVMNQKIERWIKKDPSQWFWVHRRWREEFLLMMLLRLHYFCITLVIEKYF